MSWFSEVVDRARNSVDKIGAGATKALPASWRGGGRTAFRYGAASMGGGMGLQYEYSRNKGMSSSEATPSALTGGLTYSQARGDQAQRMGAENTQIKEALLSKQQAAEERKAQGQVAVRARRAARSDGPSTKGGTLLTARSPTLGSSGAFSSMLGG